MVSDATASAAERVLAIDALVAIRDRRLAEIASGVAAAKAIWPDEIARRVILSLFPGDLSIDQLFQALEWVEESAPGTGDLGWQLPRLIVDADLGVCDLEALRDGFVQLLSAGLRWREEFPHVVCDRSYLNRALAATCARGLEKRKNDDWLSASVLALRLHDREYTSDDVINLLQQRLTNLCAEDNSRLFWADDSLLQSLHDEPDPWMRLARVILHDGHVDLCSDRDLGWIEAALRDTARSLADRAMLLEAAMRLSPDREQWREHVSGLSSLVADHPDLVAAIDQRLQPTEADKQLERWEKKQAEQARKRERQRAEGKASWLQFWRDVAEHPDTAFSDESSWNTAWNLWRAMSRNGEDSQASGWDRRFMEELFDKHTADRLRQVLMTIWRKDRPTLPSERPVETRGTILGRWQMGLAAVYAEAEDPSWASGLTGEEAELATRYVTIELNGLPTWINGLVDAHPQAVDSILGKELVWELEGDLGVHGRSILLQHISHAPDSVVDLFLPRLREWFDSETGAIGERQDLAKAIGRLGQVISVMLAHGDEDSRAHLLSVARERLHHDSPRELALTWLHTIIRIDPDLGVCLLEDRFRTFEPGPRTEAVEWFGMLFGHGNYAIGLKAPLFAPRMLLRLLRLAYQHVRVADDAQHSPDIRDHAEFARGHILTALLESKGEEGWAAKLEFVADPLCSYFKDWVLKRAEEHWANEIDSVAFDDEQALALTKTGEAAPSTNEAMFAVMCDRLDDLDDLLMRDASPRETWAGVGEERLMRREIARELRHLAKGLYNVDQEAVTADENRTDIRLRSVASDHEAVIEVKRADDRSGRDLRDTIHDQLVKKYMSAENTRSGCLLVTLAKNRKWRHPDTRKLIGKSGLVSLLREEARRVEDMMAGSVRIGVYFLDLRPPALVDGC